MRRNTTERNVAFRLLIMYSQKKQSYYEVRLYDSGGEWLMKLNAVRCKLIVFEI